MRAVWRQDTWKLGAPGSVPCQGPRLVLGLVLGLGLGLGLRLGPRPGMPKCRQGNISLEVAGATTATGVVITIAMVLSYHYPWRYRGHLRDRWCFHQYRWHDCCCCLPPYRSTSLGLWCDCCPPEGTRSLALQKSHHGVLGVTPLVVAVAIQT